VPLRLGVCLLPDLSWPEARAQWRDVEAAGIVTGWVYDHLSWRTLRDGPWLGAVPLLSALAAVTDTIRLGFLVASPNFRHPVPFAKELMTLDVISGGRVDLGLGAGGTGADATVLGGPGWSGAERATRFAETATLLDLLLRQPATSWRGVHYAADDARQIPGCVQHPRIPFTIAATGPRGLAMTAALGQGWVTYGPVTGTPGPSEWQAAVLGQSAALDRAWGGGGGGSRRRWPGGSCWGWSWTGPAGTRELFARSHRRWRRRVSPNSSCTPHAPMIGSCPAPPPGCSRVCSRGAERAAQVSARF
jgi:alkanesulfonate monooxygenase SsuD/methylene tetrahydromethanopterin reductase-like flavin-dependent oxidoreductase (luciferase family)